MFGDFLTHPSHQVKSALPMASIGYLDEGRLGAIADWSMIRKSVKRFSDKIMLNLLESITFIRPG